MIINHRAEAERHLANAARHLTENVKDMRIAEVSAWIGQGYATLAAAPVCEQEPAPLVDVDRVSEAVSWNVRRLRIARGWTQAEAGQRLGQITGNTWSYSVWSMAEAQTRPREWTATELIALTHIFGVTLSELFAPEAEIDIPF
jgi:hypothetical protein